jgi:peptidoglycan/xylan/chitin deacetylase (PgdA/CDA1 family)
MVNPHKALLASVMHRSRLDRALLRLLRVRAFPYIRVVNYHDTPMESSESFAQHLRFYRQYFAPVNASALSDFLDKGTWTDEKPGLILSFDDGLRSNADLAAPLVKEYGFTGWFFVPTEFIACSPDRQKAFAFDHAISFNEDHEDGRIAMSWDELRELAKWHVIGCHTSTHHRMVSSTTRSQIHAEVAEAKHFMQEQLGFEVSHFCWVGGEEETYSREAADAIRAAGFRYAFMTNSAPLRPETDPLQIQRTNIEADWPLEIVQFQVCGIMDLLYAGKRRRVNRLTSTERSAAK